MKLTILSTSDTHGYLLATDYRSRVQQDKFGLTRAATVIKEQQLVAANDPVIIVENGDFLQGSAFSYYQAKVSQQLEPLTQAYNQIDYSVGIVGNHEFNYGTDYLKKAISLSKRPFICANILDDNGQPALGKPYQLLKVQGLTIAILGLTTQYIPHWEAPAKIEGLHFESAVKTAKKWVPKLHQLADIVIIAYHGGFERDLVTDEPTEALTGENEGSALISQVPGIDALVTGHQHREIATVVDNVPVTQPGSKGAFVGKITLTLNQANQVTESTAQIISTAKAVPDEKMQDSLQGANQVVEDWLDQPLGRTNGDVTISDPMAVRLKPHPYIQFIQDVQRAATGAPISGTALFNNDGSGFQQVISFRSVLTNYIYPNTLAVEKVTGADLKAALEQSAAYFSLTEDGTIKVSERFYQPKPQHYNYDMYSGIDYVIDVAQPIGQRVVSLTYQGQSIKQEQELDVVINQYRAVGGGNYKMFTAAKIIREIPADMTELIADYLRSHPVVSGQVTPNFKVINSKKVK